MEYQSSQLTMFYIAWDKGEEKQVETSSHQSNDVPISYDLLQSINKVEAIGGLGMLLITRSSFG